MIVRAELAAALAPIAAPLAAGAQWVARVPPLGGMEDTQTEMLR
jgi:hypothetical protein